MSVVGDWLYRMTRILRWSACIAFDQHSGRDPQGKCWYCQADLRGSKEGE
jgi:hypothetical protein